MGFFKSRSRKTGGSPEKRDSTVTTSTQSSTQSQSHHAPQVTQPHPHTQHANRSTSNLSSVSTLLDTPTKPAPQMQRPAPPTRLSSYELFMQQAWEAEQQRAAKEEQIKRAWKAAAERRRQSNMWPQDPWRGGFGPPSNGRDSYYGGLGAMGPRRESDSDVGGLRGWLGQNGLVRH